MPSGNKYNSITETFLGNPLFEIGTLSTKAVPPADLSLVLADFTAVDLYSGRTSLGLRRGNFRLNDIPRIVGVGLWCNIADGLVQIDNADTQATGLSFQILGQSYNVGNARVQTDIFPTYTIPKVNEFNQIFEVDYMMLPTTVNYALTGQPADVGSGYFRLNVAIASTSMTFSTISVDPSYQTKPFIIRPMVVVEHTFPLLTAGF